MASVARAYALARERPNISIFVVVCFLYTLLLVYLEECAPRLATHLSTFTIFDVYYLMVATYNLRKAFTHAKYGSKYMFIALLLNAMGHFGKTYVKWSDIGVAYCESFFEFLGPIDTFFVSCSALSTLIVTANVLYYIAAFLGLNDERVMSLPQQLEQMENKLLLAEATNETQRVSIEVLNHTNKLVLDDLNQVDQTRKQTATELANEKKTSSQLSTTTEILTANISDITTKYVGIQARFEQEQKDNVQLRRELKKQKDVHWPRRKINHGDIGVKTGSSSSTAQSNKNHMNPANLPSNDALAEVAKLKKAIVELHAKLQVETSDASGLKNDNQSKGTDISQLKESSVGKDAAITNLYAEIGTIQADLEARSNDIASLNSVVETKENAITKLQTDFASQLTTMVAKKDRETEEVVTNTNARILQLEQKHEAELESVAKVPTAQLTALSASKDEEIEDLKSKVEARILQLEILEQEHAQNLTQKDTEKATAVKLAEENASSQVKQINDVNVTQLSEKDTELGRLMSLIGQMERDFSAKVQQHASDAAGQLWAKESIIMELQNEMARREQAFDQALADSHRHKEQAQLARSRLTRLEGKLSSAQLRYRSLRAQPHLWDFGADDTRGSIIVKHKEARATLRVKLVHMKSRLVEADRKYDALNQVNQATAKALTKTMDEIEEVQDECDAKDNEIDDAEKDAAEAKHNLVESIEHELAQWKAGKHHPRIGEIDTSNDAAVQDLNNEIDRLKVQLEASKDHTDCESTIQRLHDELEPLRDQAIKESKILPRLKTLSDAIDPHIARFGDAINKRIPVDWIEKLFESITDKVFVEWYNSHMEDILAEAVPGLNGRASKRAGDDSGPEVPRAVDESVERPKKALVRRLRGMDVDEDVCPDSSAEDGMDGDSDADADDSEQSPDSPDITAQAGTSSPWISGSGMAHDFTFSL